MLRNCRRTPGATLGMGWPQCQADPAVVDDQLGDHHAFETGIVFHLAGDHPYLLVFREELAHYAVQDNPWSSF